MKSPSLTTRMKTPMTRENPGNPFGKLPAKTKKKVVVIGGGPAGLECARVLAVRGHQVSLYEKGPELGGQLLIAAKAPGRDGFLESPRWFTLQMKLLKVDVHLNTEVTTDMVKKMDADAVVVATGSVPWMPPRVKGIDEPIVAECRDVILGKAKVGENVVVWAGEQNMEALTVAERIRDLLRRAPFEWGGQPVAVTVSAGLTSLKDEDSDFEEFFQRASQALSQAKEAGKDCQVAL